MTSLGIVANLSKRQVAPQNISESSETESLPLANQIDYSTQDFTGCDAKACKKECNPNQETFEGDSYPYIKLHPVYCGILAQNRILQNKPNHRTAKSFKSRFLSSKSFVMNMKNTGEKSVCGRRVIEILFEIHFTNYSIFFLLSIHKINT